jgi:hypothetical protein
MTLEEKCEYAINKGFKYCSITGDVFGIKGQKIISKYNDGYIFIQFKIDKKYYIKGHQFAWYWVYKECVECLDHINGIKDDNRICNLRSVTKQQNQWNRIKTKGYSYVKRDNKWRSTITVNKKYIHLGIYNTEQEARNAYLSAKEIYHKF